MLGLEEMSWSGSWFAKYLIQAIHQPVRSKTIRERVNEKIFEWCGVRDSYSLAQDKTEQDR